mmetsp:Transcript_8832/g.12993  ORF Transcript_8832/g.12993 Transcript_8832/m.12993 type:complete len:243 (+) Transcript_8832:110-838(+)
MSRRELLQMVTVEAPADLPEGYKIEVTQQSVVYAVEVPKGGVVKGQSFTGVGSVVISEVPMGEWRDDLFDCCALGPCHPSLLCSFFCAPIVTSQVMTRMKLNWFGNAGSKEEVKQTFNFVCGLTIAYTIISKILDLFLITYDNYGLPNPSAWLATKNIIGVVFFVYSIVIILRTRSAIRRKYDIPERHCGGCEDCCCSLWCIPCTVAQMARHTSDYNKRKAKIFTKDGLEEVSNDDTYISMA